MPAKREFKFLNHSLAPEITHRNLPHWEQPQVCYSLTWRLNDSLPVEVVKDFLQRRDIWLRSHGIVPDIDRAWHAEIALLPKDERAEYHEEFSKPMQELLDVGHGECLLRREDVRRIVTENLHHFDEQKHRLGGYVIMPNHIHVLAQCLGPTRMKPMCRNWKHYTATKIHELLGRRGHFWQGETYDHIVRSEAEFRHFVKYIAENPMKAKLREGEYSMWFP